MKTNQKVTLTADFKDAFGQVFRAGQVGTVKRIADGKALIDFDGYADQRAANLRLFQKHGEGANLVPWIAEVLLTHIEIERIVIP